MRGLCLSSSLSCLLVALFICSRGVAQTQSPEEEARAQFEAGVALFEAGQLAQASVAFARAYELRPSYKILYLVGKCENAQRHFALSLDAFTRYLSEGGSQIEAARRAEVEKEILRLRPLVGFVAVETNATGVTVFVDGRKFGTTPLSAPLPVDLGEHDVRLSREAKEVYREVVTVAGGQRVVVRAKLDDDGASKKPELAEGGAVPAGGEVSSVANAEPPSAEPPAQKPKRIWTWVALGVGGAAAVGAAVTGGLAISKGRDVEERCDGNDCPPSVRDDLDSAKSLGDATTALVVVASVGVGACVALFFLEPKWRGEAAVEVAPVAVAAEDGAAFALTGRF